MNTLLKWCIIKDCINYIRLFKKFPKNKENPLSNFLDVDFNKKTLQIFNSIYNIMLMQAISEMVIRK